MDDLASSGCRTATRGKRTYEYDMAPVTVQNVEKEDVVPMAGAELKRSKAFDVQPEDLRGRDGASSPLQPPEPVWGEQQSLASSNPAAAAVSRIRKSYFRHLSADRRRAGMEMAARIKEHMARQSLRTMRLSAIKRALHGDRHPDAWRDAISQLVRYWIATVRNGWITLTDSDDSVLPDVYPRAAEPKRRKRTRGKTDWFQQNRSKMDRGQHADFDWEPDDEDEMQEPEG
jgi:hypothetical protein